MRERIHTFHSAISQNNQLTSLIAKAQTSNDLQTVFSRCLPEALQKHCHISQFANDKLTVVVQNGNWLTKLRYFEEDLMQNLKKQHIFHSIKEISYCIDPNLTNIQKKEEAVF